MTNSTGSGYSLPRADGEVETSRLDLQNQIWHHTLDGRLFTSNLPSDINRVLDLGTGNGTWALQVAKAFPSAQVVGSDITPPPPNPDITNLEFVNADAEKPWSFPPNHFDFIHGRMLIGAIHDWPALLSRCFEHLAPGGYLELPEAGYPYESASYDNITPFNSPYLRWWNLAQQAWVKSGFDPYHTLRQEYRLEKLGFVDVEHTHTRWPMGPWGNSERERKVGKLHLETFKVFIRTAGVPILMSNGFMEKDEAERYTNEAFEDIEKNYMVRKHYLNVKITRARKAQT